MYVSVCVSVCPFVSMFISITTRLNFIIFLLHATFGRDSVFILRRYDILCTSGYVYGVMFSYYERNGNLRYRNSVVRGLAVLLVHAPV